MWVWEEASSPDCRAIRQRKPLGCACNRCVAPLIVSPGLGRLCPTPTSANTFCFSHVRASRARGCGTSASPSATASPDAGPGTPHPPPARLASAAAARRTQPVSGGSSTPAGQTGRWDLGAETVPERALLRGAARDSEGRPRAPQSPRAPGPVRDGPLAAAPRRRSLLGLHSVLRGRHLQPRARL